MEDVFPDSNGESKILESSGEVFFRQVFVGQLIDLFLGQLCMRDFLHSWEYSTCPVNNIFKVSWFRNCGSRWQNRIDMCV